MKTITSIRSLLIHPALGRLLLLTFTDNSTVRIYEEWFFHLLPDYECNDDYLIGLSIDENWINQHQTTDGI